MENRRQYTRYKIEIEARIYSTDLNFLVHVVDISEGGIGMISEKSIEIGSEISVSLFPIIKEPIVGTVMWSSYSEKDQKYFYRIGVGTEYLDLKRVKAFGFPISLESG